MHKPQDELVNKLEQAKEAVAVGGVYQHYKQPDKSYKVLHLAITESDDELCVIYQAQYEERLIFVRPLKSWLDKVNYNGNLINRFTRLA